MRRTVHCMAAELEDTSVTVTSAGCAGICAAEMYAFSIILTEAYAHIREQQSWMGCDCYR